MAKKNAVPADQINSLALTCRKKEISVSGLLNVALCRANTEELVKFDEKDRSLKLKGGWMASIRGIKILKPPEGGFGLNLTPILILELF